MQRDSESDAHVQEAVQPGLWKRRLWLLAAACLPFALAWLLRGQAEERRRTLAHRDVVTGLAFSRDSRTLTTATVGWDICVWDAVWGRERARWRSDIGSLSALALAEHGRRLVSVSDNPVRLQSWDAQSRAGMGVLDDPQRGGDIATTYLTSLLPLDDGRLIVCSYAVARTGGVPRLPPAHLWDSRNGREWIRFPAPPSVPLTCVALTGDGSTLAWGDSGGIVSVWDVRRRRPDSSLAVTLRLSRLGLGEGVSGIAFSPDGSLLAASGGTQVSLWNRRGEVLHALACGHVTWRPHLIFSPNGALLACVEDDSTVRVWSVASGRLLQSIEPGPRQRVEALAFSPDSSRLAVAAGLTVRIWDAPRPGP